MPRMYPATVRRQIAQRLRSGEAIAAIAVETGIAQATLFRWKRQALIDAGVIEGTPSVEADELAAAHKRIAQLEAELALTRDACELFNAEAVVPPKRRRAITEGLIARGHSARSACRITGLARSLFQYYRRRPVPDREIRRLIVADTITEIHQRSRGTYGGRRIRDGGTWSMAHNGAPAGEPALPGLLQQQLDTPSRVDEITDRLITAIAIGEYLPGARLPVERDLATSLGAGRMTVRAALARLVEWGLLEARRGRGGGSYVLDQWPESSTDAVGRTLRMRLDDLRDRCDAL